MFCSVVALDQKGLNHFMRRKNVDTSTLSTVNLRGDADFPKQISLSTVMQKQSIHLTHLQNLSDCSYTY